MASLAAPPACGKRHPQPGEAMAKAEGRKRPRAVATVQVDNAFARVTEWRFAPGAETGWHRHGFAYVVVPMADGRLLLETAAGESVAELTAGLAYAREAGVEHNVVNAGEDAFAFVEVEFKDRPPGGGG